MINPSLPYPAQAGYPAQYLSLQPNLPPLAQKRQLAADELALMAKGAKQWTGKWFPHLGTELWELMSDPKKQASMYGHLMGMAGGLAGGFWGNVMHSVSHASSLGSQWLNPQSVGLAALGTAVGLPFALLAHAAAEQNNGNLKDMWQRLPYRPTQRDYLSDPVANLVAPLRSANAKELAPRLLGNAAAGLTLAGLATRGRSPHVNLFTGPRQSA
jgi:hypothetical protein